MTIDQLKEKVRNYIRNARTKDALDIIAKWAYENNLEQLISDVTLLQRDMTSLGRDQMLGLIPSAEAGLRQNQLVNKILTLLDTLDNAASESDGSPLVNDMPGKFKILMLTANPSGTTKLNLDKEHSRIAEKIQDKQDQFSLTVRRAVDSIEFKEFTEIVKPQILHFSGHGEDGGEQGGIIVQNDDRNGKAMISPGGLDALFENFKADGLELKAVILNACYSEEQAMAIANHVPYVIGTTVELGDTPAIAFSVGFYFKLDGTEPNFEQAYRSGRTQAVVAGAAKSDFVLFKNAQKLAI